MSSHDRYYPYNLEIVEGQILLYKKHKGELGMIANDLNSIVIQTADSEDRKAIDPTKVHFCCLIRTVESHRKFYFVTYKQMEQTISLILKAQNYPDRLAQYEFVKALPNGLVS